MAKSVTIICSNCGADALLRREPIYDGFKKTGEKLTCSACGHLYASEDEVPFKKNKGPKVFNESDLSKPLNVFNDDERGKNCRYCVHYIVNPFTQKCGLHLKIGRAHV